MGDNAREQPGKGRVMGKQWAEVLTGTAVLVLAVAFVAFGLTRSGVAQSGGYDLIASFRSAEGISVGTDVRLAGVKVGSVTGLDLNADTFRADATISVQDQLVLPDDSAILVASEGLLGGNFVEIIPGGSPFNLEAGDAFTDTQGAVSLINLLLKFVGGDD